MDPRDRAAMGKSGKTAAECREIAEAKTEKHLQQQLEAMLRRNDIVVIRQRMDRKSNTTIGLPDILFALNSIPVAWEVKLPGKNPTDEQKKMHTAMSLNGWQVRVIRSYDEGLNHLKQCEEEYDRR
jgi:hypothetical protein